MDQFWYVATKITWPELMTRLIIFGFWSGLFNLGQGSFQVLTSPRTWLYSTTRHHSVKIQVLYLFMFTLNIQHTVGTDGHVTFFLYPSSSQSQVEFLLYSWAPTPKKGVHKVCTSHLPTLVLCCRLTGSLKNDYTAPRAQGITARADCIQTTENDGNAWTYGKNNTINTF